MIVVSLAFAFTVGCPGLGTVLASLDTCMGEA